MLICCNLMFVVSYLLLFRLQQFNDKIINVESPDSLFIHLAVLVVVYNAATIITKVYHHKDRNIKVFAVLLFVAMYAVVGHNLSQEIRMTASHEPQDKTYSHDGYHHIKIFYQMKQGVGYYDAFNASQSQDIRSRDNKPAKFWFGWRLPTLHYLLYYMPQASWIVYAFLLLSLIAMWCLYGLLRLEYDWVTSLASVSIIVPYFLYGASSIWFMHMEYWAGFVFIYGITSYAYSRRNLSLLMFAATVFTREIFLLPLFGVFCYALVRRDWKYAVKILGVVTAFAVYLYWHFQNVAQQIEHVSIFPAANIEQKLSGGINFLLTTIKFGTQLYWIRIVVPIMCLLAIIPLIKSHLHKCRSSVVLWTCSVTVLGFTITGNEFNGYWGILYVPIAASYGFVGLVNCVALLEPCAGWAILSREKSRTETMEGCD